jgi:RNA polymerase sigma-70 factor (ECF subfamily)
MADGAEGGAQKDVAQDRSALARRAQRGDLDAFSALFAACRLDVVRVCRRILASSGAAEDAASDVFLRACRSLASYDPTRDFRNWLLAIASHHSIDLLRRRGLERRLFAGVEPDEERVSDSACSPLQRLVADEDRRALDRAIASLPPKYRLPLLLRYYEDYDYAAIAQALGVSTQQVGTLLLRAKRRLRESLDRGKRPGARSEPEASVVRRTP